MTFDVKDILGATQEGGFSTEMVNIPEDEYDAVIMKVDGRQTEGKDGEQYTFLELQHAIEKPGLEEEIGRKPLVRQSIRLDVGENGVLIRKKGYNVPLGRMLEAFGMNKNGANWSPNDFVGKLTRISVKHRIDGDRTYEQVKECAPR